MADSVVKEEAVPPAGDCAGELTAKLQQIQNDIEDIQKRRKQQAYASTLGVLVIVALIAIFVYQLKSVASAVDPNTVVRCMADNAGIITHSPEVDAVAADLKNVFFPTLKENLVTQFKAHLPDYQNELVAAGNGLKDYAFAGIKGRTQAVVAEILPPLEKRIKARYPDMTDAQLHDLLKVFGAELFDAFVDREQKRVAEISDHLATLNDTVNSYKKLDDYKTISEMDRGMVENMLVESMLELWICHLNPEKAAAPVAKE